MQIKQLIIPFLSLILYFPSHAQINLVPNGSFENYIVCPNNVGQADFAANWSSLSQSPDYYNICSTATGNCISTGQLIASVPYNCMGYQFASSGNAYIGFFSLFSAVSNYREIIGAPLSNNLNIGQKYFVKFKLAFTLDNSSNSATDKIGVRFSTIPHNSVTALPPINNFAHAYTTSFVIDTTNWTTVFKSFIADSSYSHVEIGNFFDDALTNKLVLRSQATDACYYYFDDFCVSTDSLFTLNYTTQINILSNKPSFQVYPNPSDGRVLFFNYTLKKAEVSIFDMYGSLIKTIEAKSTNFIQIDMSAGVYVLKVCDEEKIFTDKIIIKNQ